MSSNSKRTVGVIVTLVVLLLLAVGAWFVFRTPGSSSSDISVAAAPRVRVGVIMSKRTAETDNFGTGPVGYERQARIARELMSPELELHPIVDPGTTQDPSVLNECRTYFGAAAPVDGGDAAALGALDAIVASHVINLGPEVLDAIERAVSESGTGFLMRMFFCQWQAAFPQIRALNGFAAEGPTRYLSSPGVECEVVGEHPLLGNLSGSGKRFKMAPNGFAGPVVGTTLIRVANGADDPKAPDPANLGAMLYVAKLGNGTIVGCPFAGAKPVPRELEQAGPGTFSVRAVKWLAEQKRASASSSTEPTTNVAP